MSGKMHAEIIQILCVRDGMSRGRYHFVFACLVLICVGLTGLAYE